MVNRISLPTRNVLDTVAHGDQRTVKWFEDVNAFVNSDGGGGGGGVLDMGDRMTGSSVLDLGTRA